LHECDGPFFEGDEYKGDWSYSSYSLELQVIPELFGGRLIQGNYNWLKRRHSIVIL
jgi:hypothetical protein